MKIVLAAVNAKYIHSNLAVYSLRAYASAYKNEIEIAEYTINQQTDDILMDLYKRSPDVLCFSCYIWNLTYVETLVREIKKVMPKLPVWVGGPEVSYDAVDVLKRLPEVTGVMFGEGEETFSELMDHYHGKGKSLAEIAGIAYRERDARDENDAGKSGSAKREICENSWRPALDLSKLPFAYEDLKEFENRIIYYESSRGCPFSCSYCLSSVDKALRFRDLELVKRELQFFIDAKVPQVKFVDRTFNCNHEHAMTIWRYLAEHDRGITNFHFEVSADLLNEAELELIGKMRPGLIQLEIGVQSTNDATLKEIRRSMKFSQVADAVTRIAQAKNVHQHLDLIAGLPHEDLERFKKSFDDVYALHPEQLQLGFLKVLKGSYMESQKDAYGLICQSAPPYEVLCSKWLSYGDVLELKMVEEMVEVYYNSGQFCHTLRRLETEFDSAYEMYFRLGKYYETHQLDKMSHSRVRRYEILLNFIEEQGLKNRELYRELLVFDLYLRERAKHRPEFAGEYNAPKEVKREAGKMVHVEAFHYDVAGACSEKDCLILFDYENRNPLTREARILYL